MKHHDLKCHEEPFMEVLRGTKTFEIRVNDRDYQVGDTLTLHEGRIGKPMDILEPENLTIGRDVFYASGREIDAVVTYMMMQNSPYGEMLNPTVVVALMAIKVLEVRLP